MEPNEVSPGVFTDLTSQQRERGMRGITSASVCGTLFYNTVLSTGLLTLLALRVTDDLRVVGLLAAIVQVAVIVQLPMAREVETWGKKRIILPSYIVMTLFVVPLAALPWLPEGGWLRLGVLVGSVALISVIRQPGLAAWMPLLGDVIPDETRGRFFGTMRTAWQSAGLALALFVAAFLGKDAGFWQFQVIFAIGAAASVLRIWFISRIPELAPHPAAAERSRLSFLAEVLRDRSFMSYLLLTGIIGFLLSVMGPFSVVYMREPLGYGDGFVIFSTQALPVAGAILTLVLWGHLADRIGNRAIFVLTTVGTAATMLVWLVAVPGSPAAQAALAASIFARGLLQAGFGIASSRYLYGALPASNKSGYTATYTVMAGLAAGLGPLVGGFVLRHTGSLRLDLPGLPLDNYKVLFAVTGLAIPLPLLFLARFRTPDDAPTREFLSFLVSHPVRTTMDLVLYSRPLDEERRAAVTRRLAATTSAVTLKELLDGLDDPSHAVREAAARGLASRRQPEVVDALLAKLREDDALIRPSLIWALGELQASEAGEVLRDTLAAPDRHARAQAALALGKVGRADAVPALEARWRAEEDVFVRACVATALSRLGSAAFLVDALRALSGDTPAVVRRQLATAAGSLLPLADDFYHVLRSEIQERGSAARQMVRRALHASWGEQRPAEAEAHASHRALRALLHAYLRRRDDEVMRLAAEARPVADMAPPPSRANPLHPGTGVPPVARTILWELAARRISAGRPVTLEEALLALAAYCALVAPEPPAATSRSGRAVGSPPPAASRI